MVAARWEVKRLRAPELVALALYVFQLLLFRGYITDDTWIYARFAENLSRHGELSFWPSDPVHAATSPLWAGLAAVGDRLGVPAIDTLLALGWVCGGVAIVLFARLARRMFADPRLVWAAVLAFSAEIWMVRWAASGMETSLGVVWLLVALDLSWRDADRIRVGRLGLWLGAGFLVRPEALVLAGLLAVAFLRHAALRRRPAFWAGLLAAPLLWAAYAWPLYGHLLPATLQAKSTPLGLHPVRLLGNLRVLGELYLLAAPVATLLWWGLAPRALRSPSRLLAAAPWCAGAWWAWTIVLPLAYVLRDVQVISRYLEMLLPVLLLLCLEAATRLQPRSRVDWGRWLPRALILQTVVSLALTAVWIAPRSRAFGRSLEAGLGDLASWIRENTAPTDEVAVYDIGYIGAHCDRRILDLGGLIHPGISELRNRVDDAEILRQGLFLRFGTPAVLIDRDLRADALDGWELPGYRLEAVLHRSVANLGLSRPEPVVYTLYRLVPAGG